ncbi:MAG: hypothetical protein ACM31G_02925 [Flavobacteriales bacterium]
MTILSLVLFISCKNDPNKQVDEGIVIKNKYHSKEIGWTIEIPEGWDVTKRDKTQKREEKGLKLINEANGIDYDASGLKQLISFQKDRIHSFAATSLPHPSSVDRPASYQPPIIRRLPLD